jgi:hypothetical protein
MGEKLIKLYAIASERLGLKGKMQLAVETKIPLTKAATEPDSPENIKIFEEAIEKLTGEPVSA